MNVHPAEALIRLITENGSQIVAEVGVWAGRTARDILNSSYGRSIREYWAIDSWSADTTGWHDDLDGKNSGRYRRLKTMAQEDWDKMYYNTCLLMFYHSQLHVVKGTSEKIARLVKRYLRRTHKSGGYFDLVFLDANHQHDAVIADIADWGPLVKKGGVLCGHDYGNPYDPQVKSAVDSVFPDAEIMEEDMIWIKRI